MNKLKLVSVLAAGLLLSGCTAANVSATPKPLEVRGSIAVPAGLGYGTGTCQTSGGYSDIAVGTQVVVKDNTGKVVATGSLRQGSPEGTMTKNYSTGTSSFPCVFPFTVPDVPAGSDFYEVEVGKRGGMTYKKADLDSPIGLSLG